MDFLIDVHLPIALSKYLDAQDGCTSIHVNQILQKWFTTDDAISRYADERGLVVISKDSDFVASHFVKRSPKKLIRIALGNIKNTHLVEIFEDRLSAILTLKDRQEFYVEVNSEQMSVI